MFLSVPPLVIGGPTPFAFGVQVAPPVFGFAAVLAIVVDRFIQPCFRFFNSVLAMGSVVRMRSRRSGEKQQRSHHQSCRCVVSKFSNQVILLSGFINLLDFMNSRRSISIQFFQYAPGGGNTIAATPIRMSDRLALPRVIYVEGAEPGDTWG